MNVELVINSTPNEVVIGLLNDKRLIELHKERLEKKMQNNYNNYTYDVLINNQYYNRKEIDLPTLT